MADTYLILTAGVGVDSLCLEPGCALSDQDPGQDIGAFLKFRHGARGLEFRNADNLLVDCHCCGQLQFSRNDAMGRHIQGVADGHSAG